MDRLDPEYSALKKESNDANKTAAEKVEAAEKLAAREKHLQPTYRQLALLYADLHESVAPSYIFFRVNCLSVFLQSRGSHGGERLCETSSVEGFASLLLLGPPSKNCAAETHQGDPRGIAGRLTLRREGPAFLSPSGYARP